MHASHSESSKKIYHRLYKLSADKYRQNNLYAIAVANHYTGFLEINLSAEIKLVPPLMEPALQILKPAS
jgi:hypothetical protein